MAGPNSDKLRLDEPVARKKLRLFYMEGIQASPVYSPLSYEMRQVIYFYSRTHYLMRLPFQLFT